MAHPPLAFLPSHRDDVPSQRALLARIGRADAREVKGRALDNMRHFDWLRSAPASIARGDWWSEGVPRVRPV